MSEARLFQILVISNWLMQLLLFVLPTSYWYPADPIIEKLVAIDGYRAILNWDDSVAYQIPLWGFLIASIGMLFFLNWARNLYLALWLYGWIATLLFGFRVSMPIQGFIGMTIGTIDGMVIYLAFLSTLRFKFKRNQN